MALIDWEKVFDKVQHCKFFDYMTRLGLHLEIGANTHIRVYEFAPEIAFPNQSIKNIKSLFQESDESRIKLAGYILRTQVSKPLRHISYQIGNGDPIQIDKCQVGQPRQQWLYRMNEAIHNIISHTIYDGNPILNDLIL